jgi:hypothetical protein
MRKETKLLFANVRPGSQIMDGTKEAGHSLGRSFRRGLAELDRHPLDFRIHGEIRDPNAKADRRPEVEYLLSRAEGRWGRATRRPVRTGKTAKDHRTGAWQQRLNNLAARAAAQ